MKGLILFTLLCIQVGWSIGNPNPAGASAFSAADSSGNRYAGTGIYGIGNGNGPSSRGNENGPSSRSNGNGPSPRHLPFNNLPAYDGFSEDNFIPEYFRNLEFLLKEAFGSNEANQKLAYNAARKALDLTTNQAAFIPSFDSSFPAFPDFRPFPPFPNFEDFAGRAGDNNVAAAMGAIGPGYRKQMAAINPVNPNMDNVFVDARNGDTRRSGGPGFYSVSSSSFASSDGNQPGSRRAETIVNDNGKIYRHEVHS